MSRKLTPATSLVSTIVLFVLATTLSLHAASFSYTVKSQSGKATQYHADFNNDGREDIVAPATGGLTVQLSNGGGTYAAPKFYALPNGNMATDFAIGQFCCAGDFIAIDAKTANFFIFAGKGDGTFTGSTKPTPNADVPLNIIAGDFNHDGAQDIAYLAQPGFDQPTHLQVMFGPLLSGDFTFGPTTPVPDVEPGRGLFVGDFDGDGKADLLSVDQPTQGSGPKYVYYGDGLGNFPTQTRVDVASADARVFDVNGDGKSDIVAHVSSFGSSQGDILTKQLAIFFGNSSRTWNETDILTSRFITVDGNTAVADFNGDSIPDIVFTEASNDSGGAPRYLVMKTGKGAGAFNSEVTLDTFPSSSVGSRVSLDTLRNVRNNRPAFAITLCSSNTCSSPTLRSYLNLTTTGFASCTAPTGFQSIHVCSPAAGSSVSSPVGFHVGAVGQTPMRKVELWIDGHKVTEQFRGAFSKYAFMDKSMPLAAGSHKVTVFAAGWDNWLEKSSFTINVQ